jgi:hypothetical protein
MRRLIRSAAVTAMTIAAMVLAEPAAATTKVTTVMHVDDTFVASGVCSFDITFHAFGSFKESDYFDDSGLLVKTILTPRGLFTVTTSAKGTTLTMQAQNFQEVFTYNPDGSVKSDTLHGIVWRFTIPGGGVVLLDAGRVTFDSEGEVLFEGGPHQLLHGDVDAFCAAFG